MWHSILSRKPATMRERRLPFPCSSGRVIWRGLYAKGSKPKMNGRDDWI
jgi:hypothetical protein